MKLQVLIVLVLLEALIARRDGTKLVQQLTKLSEDYGFMGITVEVAADAQTIFKFNHGLRDFERQLPINNNTVFRMASLSKSPTSVALLQLVEKHQLNLSDEIGSLLGFDVINPYFPKSKITLEMVLSHQSSFAECDAYYSFLHDTYTGPPFPLIRQLLTPTGKYYDLCLFNSINPPGTFYEYVNYNYALAATIVQRVSKVRFDLYMKQNVIDVAGLNSTTYRREYIQELGRVNDIAVLYRTDEKGVWTPQADNWKGSIPPRNFSSYVIGTNGAVFSPMGGMYSTVRDLTEYINVIRRKGLCTNGQRVMQSASGAEMLRLRYRYHGSNKATNSSENSYNAYGLGIQSTTYDPYDEVFPHVVVRGHWGDSYGLISEYEFAENYSFVYAINGAKDGYHPSENSFYEVERRLIHSYIYEYLYN